MSDGPLRETRFTVDVLEEGVRRLNAAKDEVESADAPTSTEGLRILEALGWAPMGVAEIAMNEADELKTHEVDSEPVTAFIDGLMLGALCADVTYEQAMGLLGRTA